MHELNEKKCSQNPKKKKVCNLVDHLRLNAKRTNKFQGLENGNPYQILIKSIKFLRDPIILVDKSLQMVGCVVVGTIGPKNNVTIDSK